MAELDTAPAPSAGSSTLGRRVQMYSLMMLSIAVCKIIRFSLPSVVPAMATALGYSTTDTAAVLAAFFPGYLISQVPAGPIVQKWGGKALNTLNLGGSALCMALVPLAARSSRLLVSIVFLVMGLCQGPSIPVLGQLNQEWAPPGIERGWALRAQGLAHSLAPAIAAGITPVIIKRGGGWQNVFNGYAIGAAVATVAWQLCAANSPAGERKKTEPKAQTGATKTPSLSSTQQQGTVTVPKAPAVAAQKVVEYRIFSLPAVQVLCVHCFCANNLNQLMSTWSPIYFVEALGCTPVRAGSLLAIAQMVNLPASAVVGVLETVMLRRQWSVLAVRKAMTISGNLLEAGAVIAYGLVKSPVLAAVFFGVMNVCLQLHQSGGYALIYEVGGKDTPTISSIANTLANSAGVVVPFMGVWLRAVFGSWMPHLLFASGLKVIAAGTFMLFASDTPARQLLAARDHAAG